MPRVGGYARGARAIRPEQDPFPHVRSIGGGQFSSERIATE